IAAAPLSLAIVALGAGICHAQMRSYVTGVTPVPAAGMAALQGGIGRSYPSQLYFAGLAPLFAGDYKNGLPIFQGQLAGAYMECQSRWLDSICTYAMVGECQYRLGNYQLALEAFEASLQLSNRLSGWMLHVQFAPSLTPDASNRSAPWGKSTRGSRPAHIPQ